MTRLSEAKSIAIERSEIHSEATDAIERSELRLKQSENPGAASVAIERSEIHSN